MAMIGLPFPPSIELLISVRLTGNLCVTRRRQASQWLFPIDARVLNFCMPCSPIVATSPLDTNLPISRFLDFPKFIDLLTKSSLHFCRSDLMGDKLELLTPQDFSDRPFETKVKQMIEASVRLQVFINS